jgi:hypothetical protein
MKEKLPTETQETTEKLNTSRCMGKVYEIWNLALEKRRILNKFFTCLRKKYKKYLDIYETHTINDAEPERLKKG